MKLEEVLGYIPKEELKKTTQLARAVITSTASAMPLARAPGLARASCS